MHSDEQLKEIEIFAYQYLTREEIEIITGISSELLRNLESDAGKAFMKGRLLRKAEYHQSVIDLSKQLSSPAMLIESKIAQETYLNDNTR